MNSLHMCSEFDGGLMNKKSEIVKQGIFEIEIMEEQQFCEDVRLILQHAREQADSNAIAIMTHAYWNVGQRIVEQKQIGEKKA